MGILTPLLTRRIAATALLPSAHLLCLPAAVASAAAWLGRALEGHVDELAVESDNLTVVRDLYQQISRVCFCWFRVRPQSHQESKFVLTFMNEQETQTAVQGTGFDAQMLSIVASTQLSQKQQQQPALTTTPGAGAASNGSPAAGAAAGLSDGRRYLMGLSEKAAAAIANAEGILNTSAVPQPPDGFDDADSRVIDLHDPDESGDDYPSFAAAFWVFLHACCCFPALALLLLR